MAKQAKSPASTLETELSRHGGVRTLAQLGAKKGQLSEVRRVALDELLSGGRALRKGKYIVLNSALPTEESERGRIGVLLKASKNELHTEKTLRPKLEALFDAGIFRLALEQLVKAGEISRWEVKGLRKIGLVYGPAWLLAGDASSTRKVAGPSAQATAPKAESQDTLIRNAYLRVAQETGLPDIYISRLQQRAGLDMESIKAWLRAHVISKGEGTLSSGDWAACTPEERAGAVELRGQARLLVRLVV